MTARRLANGAVLLERAARLLAHAHDDVTTWPVCQQRLCLTCVHVMHVLGCECHCGHLTSLPISHFTPRDNTCVSPPAPEAPPASGDNSLPCCQVEKPSEMGGMTTNAHLGIVEGQKDRRRERK